MRPAPRELATLAALSALAAAAVACSGAGEEPTPPSAPAPTTAEPPAEPAPPPSPAEPATRTVTVGVGGDVLVHLKVWRAATEHADEGGFRHVFGELRSVIGEDEVAFANLETPLSTRIDPETGDPPVLGAPAEVAEGLAFAGIDAVAIANNHSYDQTAAGLGDTIEALRAAGVGHAGAAVDPAEAPGPAIIERDGVRVALVAFTERVNRGPAADGEAPRVARWDDEAVRGALERAREQADVVVASIHWSHDFRAEPLERQHTRARLMIDAGADLVMGHGPHVLQEVERLPSPRGEAVVAHSLGNLVSNQGLRYFVGRAIPDAETMHPAVVLPEVRDGAWVRVRFELDDGAVRVAEIEAVPLWTDNNYLALCRHEVELLDIRPRALAAMDPATRAERLPVITAALGDAVTLR